MVQQLEHLLSLLRTWVWFPGPTWVGSQLPLNIAPGGLSCPLLTSMAICMHIVHIKNINIPYQPIKCAFIKVLRKYQSREQPVELCGAPRTHLRDSLSRLCVLHSLAVCPPQSSCELFLQHT